MPPERLDLLRGAALVALVAGACARSGRGGGSQLTASWSGSDTGHVVAPASAVWCPVARRLEIMATRDDKGFGLVIYPEQDPVGGEYPGFDAGIDTVHRPGSAGALRWFSERAVVGYQSDSGSTQLTTGAGGLDVRFGFRMRSINGRDTIRATGEASHLVPGSCPADSVPSGAPRQ